MESSEELCIFCNDPLSIMETQKLGQKGVEGIQNASVQRKQNVNVYVGLPVHIKCRKRWVNKISIKSDLTKISDGRTNTGEPSLKRALRSEAPSQFHPQTHCFLCATERIIDSKSKKADVVPVKTKNWTESIRQCCHRRNDAWGTEVLARLNVYPDCFAADAVYHGTCSSNFRNNQEPPSCYRDSSTKRKKKGRPVDELKKSAFEAAVNHLEAHEEHTFTVVELVKTMQEYLGEEEKAYSVRYMKQCLLERYGEDIIIAESDGMANVVTLKKDAKKIIQDFHKADREQNDEAEKRRLIKTAAALIQSDIKMISANIGMSYPSLSDLESLESHLDFLPSSLRQLLNHICLSSDTIKIASIGQAIMQSARPRSLIAPLQIGLGVQLHHSYAKRFLVDTLNHLGFCSSYTEVQRFEANAALHSSFELPVNSDEGNSCVQFVADNVDHNIQTLAA